MGGREISVGMQFLAIDRTVWRRGKHKITNILMTKTERNRQRHCGQKIDKSSSSERNQESGMATNIIE